MTPAASEVPLNRLHFNPSINARTGVPDEGIDQLIASIAALGLLQPLIVRRSDVAYGYYQVVAGSRRLTALNILAERGALEADRPIPVTVCDGDDDEAREISLAENVIREPMHPVDQYEAFSRQADAGRSPVEIASRFGVAERLVRQRIALGALHPDIRAAWRAGTIRSDAAEAFTLARDPMHQKQVYLRLETAGNLYGSHIRAALGANTDAGSALKLVGLDAYRAAGGEVIEDLFGENSAISDPALAKRLAADIVQTECDRLVAEEGWSFALPRASIKDAWSWAKSEPSQKIEFTPAQLARKAQLGRLAELMLNSEGDWPNEQELSEAQRAALVSAWAALDPQIFHDDGIIDPDAIEEEIKAIDLAAAATAYSARQKKKAGCLVDFDDNGALQVTYGRIKPGAATNAKTAKGKKGQDPEEAADSARPGEEAATPEPPISATLRAALTAQRTLAAAATMRGDAHLALRACLAALETSSQSPIMIDSNGHASAERDDEEDIGADGSSAEFGARLARLQRLPEVAVLQRLASAVACAINLGIANIAAADALVAALDAEEFRREALEAFDPSSYFKGVNAELCNRALDEMGLPAKPRPKKKGELAELGAKEAMARRWLPIELRHPSDLKKPSLAQAMESAIAADEDAEAAE